MGSIIASTCGGSLRIEDGAGDNEWARRWLRPLPCRERIPNVLPQSSSMQKLVVEVEILGEPTFMAGRERVARPRRDAGEGAYRVWKFGCEV